MSEADAVNKSTEDPVTFDSLCRDLANLGIEPGSIVLVHSSLSALGWVCGGAQTVIEALQQSVRSFGTIVMPAHSGHLSEPSAWRHPPVPESWWETIRDTMPAYDPDKTVSRGVGAIPELFRNLAEVVRSIHPQFSFAAWGEKSISIVADHSLDFGLGDLSPLGRLYEADGKVLLLGSGFSSNTSFHLAEFRTDYPGKTTVQCGAPVTVDGHRRWKQFEEVDSDGADFEELGAAFLKSRRYEVRTGKVGYADCFLFRQRDCVDFASDWLPRHRHG